VSRTTFNEALGLAVAEAERFKPELGHLDRVFLRDLKGRISVAFRAKRAMHENTFALLAQSLTSLGPFRSPSPVLCSDDLFDPEVIFSSADVLDVLVDQSTEPVRLLDRAITGQDWAAQNAGESDVPTLVFYGFKGGVGRSTALTVLCWHLASLGKRVLVLDMDLESPGLSGLVEPNLATSSFGIVDWLIADGLGDTSDIIEAMSTRSFLAQGLDGEIIVAPASTSNDHLYLDKLSRVYGPGASGGVHAGLQSRLTPLLRQLAAHVKPDLVLIDSRAGLHDIAAWSITGLRSYTLLFATNSGHTWPGYRSLFNYWRVRPTVARSVRNRIKMVQSMLPETGQREIAEAFLENSWALFTETLYDEVGGVPEQVGDDVFSFDLKDESAPHYPFRIGWNRRFQEFDPNDIITGLLQHDMIRASYGELFDGVAAILSQEPSL
jgi:hypothetical protein